MAKATVKKTYADINRKIANGDVVVVTAEEMVRIVKENGAKEAAHAVDVVTTGTFAPMCSSGAMINFGHFKPGLRATDAYLNGVRAYASIAAVDAFIGVTEPHREDPLNKVYPGKFRYGGGHVIEDLVAGKPIHLEASGYATSCYPGTHGEKELTIQNVPSATLCNPRNAYQNYKCAINTLDKTIYTYLGPLRPYMGNANYCNAGELSPLMNDPYFKTIGLGTRIFLGGGIGYVTWPGTQHNPAPDRGMNGVPLRPAGTLWVMGDLKQMNRKFLRGVSIKGYGTSLAVGVGVPIPILNEEMAAFTGVSDDDIFTQVVDYGVDYPSGISKIYERVSYAELKSGEITIHNTKIPTVPLSSMVKAREIAHLLKAWIEKGDFTLTEPVFTLPAK